ncbi:mechanosensitive ion channel family protein [Methanoculleus sp. FWC-SCC1]|uniref:Mechanosensitive ion channel family protein n=1 Tax=Methanoculleus frigidifontis TaxID=2584085 RepID=A0ABT8M870_9EURY|nr:mechanosensitive ion channel family protein [Methanoculleus sp. FWC-SCC1]MDN7024129.1 mechanosensitive ion channel family protein [Methanoculleus sp. FWC-SCC1]
MSLNVTAVLETPVGPWDFTVGNLLVVIVILAVGVAVAKFLALNVRKALAEKVPKNDLELLAKIVYYATILVALMVALPNLNLDLSGLLVAGGIASLVIAFASQSVVSNLVSGLFLMVERPIKIGDNIGVEGISGNIEDVRVLSTVVRTYDGVYVRIPNEKVFTSNITNYVQNVARRFEYTVGIRYSDDADTAIRIVKETIWQHPFALKEPAPSVFVDSLGDNSVNLTVYIWAPAREWWGVRTELLWQIKVALEENGIEIPFPQRTLWFPNGLNEAPGKPPE